VKGGWECMDKGKKTKKKTKKNGADEYYVNVMRIFRDEEGRVR